ncbi:disease resistance protein RPM1-like [Syzygium oleosum]|uniref:disease resistance protein RPM1-like n=1 Tax=Syzygium oleosum TaxID=219896 RepID=UPI0024BA0F0C|nr:disease resistance protein RPM1-like [Syzygium oleosum]
MAASDTRSCTMVDEATAQILSQKLDILLSRPVCAECLPMHTRAEDAKAKLARIQVHFSTQCRPSETTEWSGRLRRAMYDAEECIDKFHLREARERSKVLHMAAWPIAALVSKYKLWSDLSLLVNKMKESCDEKFLKEEAEGKSKEKPASSSSHASVPWQGQKFARLTSFWDRQAPTNFLCREEQKKVIRKRIEITEKYERWSSIWGEQGTGKTFLARWAYNQAKYMGYEWRAWVRVSAGMDPRELLLEILMQANNVAGDVKDLNMDEIKTKLLQKLAEINKYFIVLDDVQPSDIQLLQELLWSTPALSQGHIITTTQDNSIAQYSGKQIKLEKLSEDESQRMLAWKLHKVSDGQSFSNEEKDILSKCRGLPLYISLLGGFLSNVGEDERTALAKEGSMTTLLDILQLSCHKLPVHLKPCFIYMALFPVGFPIPTRRLVRLWLAEGLLDLHCQDIERERIRQPEDVGETFILELADRNVIDVVSWRKDGSPKACQMLTSLFDMICPIAMSTGFLHIHATSKSKDGSEGDSISQQQQPAAQLRERTKIRWLAEHTNIVTDNLDSNYPDLNLGHVHSFLSFYQRRGMLTKDISTFLRKTTSKTGYSLLRVLDLEGVYKPYLQGVLHKLVLLRYLGLRSTVLDSIPSAIADLHHLETLDIKHTNITWLPSSLWKARKLRHLHLNWFYIDLNNILKACSNNVMALTQLQTLSGLVIGEVKENLMRDHMDSLTTLTTLKLFLQRSGGDTSGAVGKAVADWISFRLTNLQSLTFGVIQAAEPKKEANPAEEAEPAKGAHPTKEKPAKKESKPTKEESKPATLPMGPLPELSLANQHHDLLELYLLGQLNKPIWTQLLPVSLRVLTLSGSMVEAHRMPELGVLLRNLRTLRLLANSFVGTRLTFVKDGFPSLNILKIWKLPELDTVIIEQGAMPHLKELDFRRLDVLKNVQGIKECKELENIWEVVKKGSPGFVDHMKIDMGTETNAYKIEDTETPELTDDDIRDDNN